MSVSPRGNPAKLLSILLLPLFFAACGAPKADPATEEGREAIYSAVVAALTRGDCDVAIRTIDPLYHSAHSTHRARFLRGSAYACRAGLNFFTFVQGLTESDLSASGFWKSMARLFPDPHSARMEASWQSVDSFLTVLRDGTVIASADRITASEFNTGSRSPSDRSDDANVALLFSAMATIGTTENRYGAPTGDYSQGTDLPWTTGAAVNGVGCAYAGAITHLFDAVGAVRSIATGSLATSLGQIADLEAGFNAACGGTCSSVLRDRASCEAADAADEVKTDAAAIVSLVNASWL